MIWLVGIGGSAGALLRYWLGGLIKKHQKQRLPISTWLINVAGSFLLGWLAALFEAGCIGDVLWLTLGVGFCGAFTTFSTFSYEAMTLLQGGRLKTAVIYVVTSLLVTLVAAGFGFWL